MIRTARDAVETVRNKIQAWDTPFVELDCFVYCIAYGARCTHSLEPSKTEWEENIWPYLLKTEGEALLREATG
jgi:hypothetical protein